MDTTRQNKVARLIQKELSMIFQKKTNEFQNKLISVTVVRVSQDISLAKVYLSIFPGENSPAILELINLEKKNIRKELGNIVKNQLRIIPELAFFIDDSLDHALRIEELLKK